MVMDKKNAGSFGDSEFGERAIVIQPRLLFPISRALKNLQGLFVIASFV
jgi:hypothetical protein